MSHRVETIVDAVVSTLTPVLAGPVLKHRFLSLSEDELEVPATLVTLGEDDVDALTSDHSDQGNLLQLDITMIEAGTDGPEAMTGVMAQRTAIHKALMADPSLGLAFVLRSAPAGASKPIPATGGERIAVAQVLRWQILYTHPLNDPS